jgi:hypothetical protein
MAPTRRDLLRTLPAIAAGLGAASCGYALAGRGSFLPAYIKTLGIPMFGNTTPQPAIEQTFTQKVREEFQASGRYTVTPSDSSVDGIVRGEILSVSSQPVGLNDQQLASRHRFTVVVKVAFEDVKQQKTLWENPALSFSEEYDLGTATGGAQDFASFAGNNRAAFDRIATDFAKSVVSAILEAF